MPRSDAVPPANRFLIPVRCAGRLKTFVLHVTERGDGVLISIQEPVDIVRRFPISLPPYRV